MNAAPAFHMADQAPLDPDTLRVLSDPVRSFIVYSLVGEAKTVKQLAAELACPPTRLYYHVDQLVRHGLIGVESTRLVSGIVEKHYRAAAREFVLDRERFVGEGTPDPQRLDALLAFVFDQTRQDIQRQVERGAIDLRQRGPERGSLMAYRNVLRLSAEQADRLYQRLFDFWQEYESLARMPAADGELYAFTVALYPNAVSTGSEPPASGTRRRRKR